VKRWAAGSGSIPLGKIFKQYKKGKSTGNRMRLTGKRLDRNVEYIHTEWSTYIVIHRYKYLPSISALHQKLGNPQSQISNTHAERGKEESPPPHPPPITRTRNCLVFFFVVVRVGWVSGERCQHNSACSNHHYHHHHH
jgi:hypothetical protein